MFYFNDALNTFYLRIYGVRHMVKDHSDSEKGNPLPPHRLLLSINSKGSFICAMAKSSVNGLVGIGFASRYRLKPRTSFFKGPMGRCTAISPFSLSITSNRVTTNY